MDGAPKVERVIPSLAMLKVNWDTGHDYIDNFVPFVAECIRVSSQAEVSLPDLQDLVAREFGLRIPQNALKTILRRAVKAGYITRTQGIYRRIDHALDKLTISQTREQALRQHEALVQKLTIFCDTKYQVKWSQEEAETALLLYLEEHSIPILAAAVEGAAILPPTDVVKHAEFLVNAFVAELHKTDPEGFDFLETVVKGRMLADVLLFPELGGIIQNFHSVEIYLDTPFMLRALGLAGRHMETPSLEVINLLYEENANLRVFEHTRDEIHGVLDAALTALRNRGFLDHAHGETMQYFIDSNYQKSDVELLIARLEDSFRRLHIKVRAKPQHTAALGLDEAKLRDALRQNVGYRRQEALNHDLDCLTAIHRLRNGQLYRHIENCNAMFVTTNASLARCSARFFTEEFRNVGGAVPHCVLDYLLGTLVWLKRPLKAPDLPRKRMIANCYAALNPPDNLWRRYLGEMDRLRRAGLITENDYLMLRYSMEARTALMDLTLGDADAFSEGTVEQVLDKAKASLRAQTEATLQSEQEARSRAEQRAESIEASAKARLQAQLDRLRYIGATIGLWTSRAFLAAVIGLLLVSTYLTLPKPFPPISRGWPLLFAPALLLFLALFTIVSRVFGGSILSMTRNLEVRISGVITRSLCKLLHVSDRLP